MGVTLTYFYHLTETDAPAWCKADVWKDCGDSPRPSDTEISEFLVDDATKNSSGVTLPPVLVDDFATLASDVILKCCSALIDAEPELTRMDTIVGDGDCGITMMRGAKEISQRLESGKLRVDHPSTLFSDVADAVSASMGGTSGVLLELMFRKASTTCTSTFGEGITPKELSQAFQAGTEAISLYGGAREGSRTMLDALFPAAYALVGVDGSHADMAGAALAARRGADDTASMGHAEAGRSNYLNEDSLIGTPDPGAVAVAIVLESMASVVPGA